MVFGTGKARCVVLKTKVNPSQRSPDNAHEAWLISKMIFSALTVPVWQGEYTDIFLLHVHAVYSTVVSSHYLEIAVRNISHRCYVLLFRPLVYLCSDIQNEWS